jgi:hypothetical protein
MIAEPIQFNMKNALLILSSILLIGTMSCSEEEMIQRREDKIMGTWKFDKAFFLGNNALFRDNITHRYEDDILTFYTDYTCTWDDVGQQYSFEGDWFVNLEVYTDPNGAENIYFLDALFYGEVPEEDFGFYAEVEWLTQNSMTISFFDVDGEYTYKLTRL